MKDYFDEIIGYEDIKKELRIISDMLNKGIINVSQRGTIKMALPRFAEFIKSNLDTLQ